jgi:hypothetical protein
MNETCDTNLPTGWTILKDTCGNSVGFLDHRQVFHKQLPDTIEQKVHRLEKEIQTLKSSNSTSTGSSEVVWLYTAHCYNTSRVLLHHEDSFTTSEINDVLKKTFTLTTGTSAGHSSSHAMMGTWCHDIKSTICKVTAFLVGFGFTQTTPVIVEHGGNIHMHVMFVKK